MTNPEPVLQGWDPDASLKPLLGLAVSEAVKLALIDSVMVPCAPEDSDTTGRPARVPTDEERARWQANIYSMPDECMAQMDPGALAKNVANRLLGGGGWTVRGVYSGNASPREILDACVVRPDEDPLGDIKAAMGLRDT